LKTPLVVAVSFLLTRAFGRRTQNSADLAQVTFDTVYAASERSALPDDAWQLLDDRLYRSYYWPNWDRCHRIRETTVGLFVGRKLDPELFVRITTRDDVFASLVDIAGHSFSGNQFLKSVLKTLAHDGNQPERLHLVKRAVS
jgi:hypothetical protein